MAGEGLINAIPQLLYPKERAPSPFYRKLGGPHGWFEWIRRKENLLMLSGYFI